MNLGSMIRLSLFGFCILPYALQAAPTPEEAALCRAANAPIKKSKFLPLKKSTATAVQDYKNLWKSFCSNNPNVSMATIAEAAVRLQPAVNQAFVDAPEGDGDAILKFQEDLPTFLPLFSGSVAEDEASLEVDISPLSHFVSQHGQDEDKKFFASLGWFNQEGLGNTPWIMQTSDVGFCWYFGEHAWAKSLQKFEEARSFKTKAYRNLIQASEDGLIRDLKNMDRDGLTTCSCISKESVQKDLQSMHDLTEKKPALQDLNKVIKDRLNRFSKLRFHQEGSCEANPYVRNGETTIFGFRLENSSKRVSFVKSEQPPYYLYRFGKSDQVELEFPASRTETWKAFAFVGEGPRSTLTFNNGPFSYAIYDEQGAIGIRVKNMKTGQESDLKGDLKTREGSLASLNSDVRFKTSPKPASLKSTEKCYAQLTELQGEKARFEFIRNQPITEGLPADFMQTLNRMSEKLFLQNKTELAKDLVKGTKLTTWDCSGMSYDQVRALAIDDSSESSSSLSFAKLGSRIVTLHSTDYSDSGVHPTGGGSNLKFFRIADGKEISRDKLFTPAGIAKMNKAVRKSFDCDKKQKDGEDPIEQCEQFESVLTQGHFDIGGDGRITVAFSDLEISGHAAWVGDALTSFSPQEFDTFLR